MTSPYTTDDIELYYGDKLTKLIVLAAALGIFFLLGGCSELFCVPESEADNLADQKAAYHESQARTYELMGANEAAQRERDDADHDRVPNDPWSCR